MHKRRVRFVLCLVIAAWVMLLGLHACSLPGPVSSTMATQDALYTSAVETIRVHVAIPTFRAVTPTPTEILPTLPIEATLEAFFNQLPATITSLYQTAILFTTPLPASTATPTPASTLTAISTNTPSLPPTLTPTLTPTQPVPPTGTPTPDGLILPTSTLLRVEPAFTVSFLGIISCSEQPVAVFQVTNISQQPLESLNIFIEERSTRSILHGPLNNDAPFLTGDTQCLPGRETLVPGQTAYVAGALSSARPRTQVRASLQMCTQNSLSGTCTVRTFEFSLPR